MNAQIIISKSAYSNGWGSMPWKTVSGLSAEERQAIRNGAVVLMTNCPPSGGNNGTGTTVREVYEFRGRFYHRVPSAEILNVAGKKND